MRKQLRLRRKAEIFIVPERVIILLETPWSTSTLRGVTTVWAIVESEMVFMVVEEEQLLLEGGERSDFCMIIWDFHL